jgi:putative oxidoreductase
MAYAYFRVHIHRSFFPINNAGEITVALCFIFLYLSAAGPGPIALSHVLKKKR